MSIIPLRKLAREFPELQELHDEWVVNLPNLRVYSITAPTGVPIFFEARIINDGTSRSAACDVIGQFTEISSPTAGQPVQIFNHAPICLRLAPLAPGMISAALEFGHFVPSELANIKDPAFLLCVIIDPATSLLPHGEVFEFNEGDNADCLMYDPLGRVK